MPTVIYRLFIYTIFINIPKWDKSYFFKKHFEKKFFFICVTVCIYLIITKLQLLNNLSSFRTNINNINKRQI